MLAIQGVAEESHGGMQVVGSLLEFVVFAGYGLFLLGERGGVEQVADLGE